MAARFTALQPNVLFVTFDQFRADAMGCAGHPLVETPTLDKLAADGVRFARHYAGAAPCAPGRAALYTGMYQMNNRVVANGTPLDDRFDNVARISRRAGYEPILFGYTDQGVDPRVVSDPSDPRLSDYEGVLPGFDVGLDLPGHHKPWLAWLETLGYEVADAEAMLRTENERPAEHSASAFLANHVIDWLAQRPTSPNDPWFVHASFIRPHPPYCAPGVFANMYDPSDCPVALPTGDDRHPMHDTLLTVPGASAPRDPAKIARIRAQYYGMISHNDEQLQRIIDAIIARGEWDDTVVVLTSDHGEQLGDQGLIEKAGFFESSFHIAAIVRDPRCRESRGTVVREFTEAVDIVPTICEAIGAPIPAQCDGMPLTEFLRGETPTHWRTAAHYEWDWRDAFIPSNNDQWPRKRRLEHQRLVVQRSDRYAYVHFGDGSWRCHDLHSDPTWCTLVTDANVIIDQAHALLDWYGEHLDRTMTSMLLRDGGIGRWPEQHPGSSTNTESIAPV